MHTLALRQWQAEWRRAEVVGNVKSSFLGLVVGGGGEAATAPFRTDQGEEETGSGSCAGV